MGIILLVLAYYSGIQMPTWVWVICWLIAPINTIVYKKNDKTKTKRARREG
jgi:hypothetical protein